MRLAATLVLTLAVAACGGDTPAPGATSGASVPLPEHPGAASYAEHCADCHGADLRGTTAGPSHLSWVYEPNHHPDAAFEAAIRHGVRAHHWSFGDMAPVDDIDEDEIPLVIAYVRSVQEAEGFEPYPPG